MQNLASISSQRSRASGAAVQMSAGNALSAIAPLLLPLSVGPDGSPNAGVSNSGNLYLDPQQQRSSDSGDATSAPASHCQHIVFPNVYQGCSMDIQDRLIGDLTELFQKQQGVRIGVKEKVRENQEDRKNKRIRFRCRNTKCKFRFQVNYDEQSKIWYIPQGTGNFTHTTNDCFNVAPPRARSVARKRKVSPKKIPEKNNSAAGISTENTEKVGRTAASSGVAAAASPGKHRSPKDKGVRAKVPGKSSAPKKAPVIEISPTLPVAAPSHPAPEVATGLAMSAREERSTILAAAADALEQRPTPGDAQVALARALRAAGVGSFSQPPQQCPQDAVMLQDDSYRPSEYNRHNRLHNLNQQYPFLLQAGLHTAQQHRHQIPLERSSESLASVDRQRRLLASACSALHQQQALSTANSEAQLLQQQQQQRLQHAAKFAPSSDQIETTLAAVWARQRNDAAAASLSGIQAHPQATSQLVAALGQPSGVAAILQQQGLTPGQLAAALSQQHATTRPAGAQVSGNTLSFLREAAAPPGGSNLSIARTGAAHGSDQTGSSLSTVILQQLALQQQQEQQNLYLSLQYANAMKQRQQQFGDIPASTNTAVSNTQKEDSLNEVVVGLASEKESLEHRPLKKRRAAAARAAAATNTPNK
eukprot:CAMPEP_0172452398 /NCGR_PEP_ID=MMETSP1065-20121228/10076_1 /TAXON_ID=265537 /ORGANISM="Amphiprora paludosa, Strain CCMP125" /LENGTH=646 /DNA_ID=CAMNT_0013204449 /DNA_START=268 /DNA_END=2208 /DNA_ORIENTATION=+